MLKNLGTKAYIAKHRDAYKKECILRSLNLLTPLELGRESFKFFFNSLTNQNVILKKSTETTIII